MSPRRPEEVQREVDDLRRRIGFRMHTDGDFATAQSLLTGNWAQHLDEAYMNTVFPMQTQAVANALREAYNDGALAGMKAVRRDAH
jgi:hypothetical protein